MQCIQSVCQSVRQSVSHSGVVNKGGGELDKALLRDGERGAVAGAERVCEHRGKRVFALCRVVLHQESHECVLGVARQQQTQRWSGAAPRHVQVSCAKQIARTGGSSCSSSGTSAFFSARATSCVSVSSSVLPLLLLAVLLVLVPLRSAPSTASAGGRSAASSRTMGRAKNWWSTRPLCAAVTRRTVWRSSMSSAAGASCGHTWLRLPPSPSPQ